MVLPIRTATQACVGTVVLAVWLGLVETYAGGAFPTAGSQSIPARTVDPRPNIVLISTDDQRASDMRWMPLTRQLIGSEGVTFVNGLSPHPLCCPARAEILTGQYAQNNGVLSNDGDNGGYAALRGKDNTIASWLQSAGYTTGFTGKFLNNYHFADGRPAGWSYWNPIVWSTYQYHDFTVYDEGIPQRIAGYSTDYLADDSIGFIDRAAASDKPFFLWSSYVAPHETCGLQGTGCVLPPDPAARHVDLYPNVRNSAEGSLAFDEANVSDKPSRIRYLPRVDRSGLQRLFTQRIRSLAAVDEAVAATVAAVDATGELDNTVFLFTSDNGMLLGEHRYKGKVFGYEESVRVPFLVRGPGFPAGVTRKQVATSIDIAPTFAKLAGVTPARVLDGRSLLPAIHRATYRHGGTVLVQGGMNTDFPNARSRWMFRGVRTSRYLLVRWSGDGFVELYDRSVDPWERLNVAGSKRYAGVRKELLFRTNALSGCAGVACRRKFGATPEPTP